MLWQVLICAAGVVEIALVREFAWVNAIGYFFVLPMCKT